MGDCVAEPGAVHRKPEVILLVLPDQLRPSLLQGVTDGLAVQSERTNWDRVFVRNSQNSLQVVWLPNVEHWIVLSPS